MNNNTLIETLTSQELKFLTYELVSKWLESNGKDALYLYSGFEEFLRYERIELPTWVSSLDSEEVDVCLKASLIEIYDSDDFGVKNWLEEACDELKSPRAQSLELTILTTGFVLMLVILAARVKRVKKGKIEFYEGIPKDLSEIIQKSSRFLRKDL
ncbi:hypothetical protein [Roseivirga pacifica]|uniref:hypothetical protein n=1 Tax=Roseivirga pacifica TaxID=1267423 RepID=UPI003BAE910C